MDKPSLTMTFKISTYLTDGLTMAQTGFAQKVNGQGGMKPQWLDSQFRTTAPKWREVGTWAEE